MNYANHDDVVAQLRGAGLLVEEPLIVGRLTRCRVDDDREKRGWYLLHERVSGPGVVLVGSFGVWRGNDAGSQKVTLAKGTPLTPEQRAAMRAAADEARRAETARRKAEGARAARRASAMWGRLAQQGESEYLRRKGVLAHGVRFGPSGSVILPLLDVHGRIHGLQAIYPSDHPKRKRLKRDKDFWPAGLVKQGHFFLIGSPPAGPVCLVCEGYATGASLFEATGYPVAVAFDAGNLVHTVTALRARWRDLRVLVCADDDYLGKCRGCGALCPTSASACPHCGEPPGLANAGVQGASAAALAGAGHWLAPRFAAERPLDRKGSTDFNDLHGAEGLHAVRAQVEARLTELGWLSRPRLAATQPIQGEGGDGALRSIGSLDELHERYALVYEAPEAVFDGQEHVLVPLSSMRNLCSSRQLHRNWMESLDKRVVRLREVGFDPTERDENITCNLWGGWPTVPRRGTCDRLLALGEYLCSNDPMGADMWRWLLRWLAYPVQHPGAKMKTAVIMHGPQGTGKNLFFESVLRIYGVYGAVVDQDAIEDKHNDFMSRKLMLVADEVVARQEMYHAKNKLKGLVTSDWIRINPKHLASYRERNHVQIVFLSNEVQPMALERDDRRYAVIWTPPKWDAAMYHEVLREIDGGGIQALHHHLLTMDLGDFGPATLPPWSEAKRDLVELGLDSSERFYNDWLGEAGGTGLPVPVTTCRSEDLYRAYRHWCTAQGVHKPAQLSTFVGAIAKRPGVGKVRGQHYRNFSHTQTTQSVLITPPGQECPHGLKPRADSINAFSAALQDWIKESTAGAVGGARGARTGTHGGDDEAF